MASLKVESQMPSNQIGRNKSEIQNRYLNTKSTRILQLFKAEDTTFGTSFWDCILPGRDMRQLKETPGLIACDPDCYRAFAEAFSPVIQQIHSVVEIDHPPVHFGEAHIKELKPLDLDENYIVETVIRVTRNVAPYPFVPKMSKEDFEDCRNIIVRSLNKLADPDLKGQFVALDTEDEHALEVLESSNYLFKLDPLLKHAPHRAHFPVGRGVFFNQAHTLLVWINQEDHLRFISMQGGGNLAQVYSRLISAVLGVQKRLKMWRDDHLGFLTVNPANLGTGMRVTMVLRFPFLSTTGKLEEACDALNLSVTKLVGKHPLSETLWEVQSRECFGATEWQLVKDFYNGIKVLLRLEREKIKPCLNVAKS